ncbi:MAG: pteridine reductase [Gammaproteobacteria bacterium]|nr:pteridine reductase [Gammaproteobacteria bacterium]
MNNSSRSCALVTGGARRIGAEIARHLHQAGLNILLHYNRSYNDAIALQTELNQQRADSVHLLQADLLDTTQLPRLAEQAAAAWGRLDVLVNNASTFYPTLVGDITEADWVDLMGSNLKAPLFLSQAATPFLQRQQGCIINIIDIHWDRPMRKHVVYNAAKAGLANLTKSLARELAPAIRVNGVSPGAIIWPENDMLPETQHSIVERVALERSGEPADIAKTVKFLAVDAPYITGQIIAVDGGRSLYM